MSGKLNVSQKGPDQSPEKKDRLSGAPKSAPQSHEKKETRSRSREEREKMDKEREQKEAEEKMEKEQEGGNNQQKPKEDANEPEAPKDFMTNLMSKIEHYKNFFAYHLAPIIASLQTVPFLAGDGNLTMLQAFLGGERTMLFTSIRKKNIQPEFNEKAPETDSEAIAAITDMAEQVHGIHAPYTMKRFFDEAVKAFAADLQGRGEQTFKLPEFAEFVKNKVFDTQKVIAEKEKAAAPEASKKAVELKQDNEEILASQEGKASLKFKYNDAEKNIIIDGKTKWKLVHSNADIPVLALTAKNPGTLEIKIRLNAVNRLSTFEKDDLSALFDAVSSGKTYTFTRENLSFELQPA